MRDQASPTSTACDNRFLCRTFAGRLRKRDLFDLFDTDPDLSGFDVDVSLYVRDTDDTDVRLFWRPVEHAAPPEDAPAPSRDELCPAPIGGAKNLVERKNVRAWHKGTKHILATVPMAASRDRSVSSR